MSATKNLIESWLSLQCSMLAGAARAVVLQADADGAYQAVAQWPENAAATPALANVAAAAAAKPSCTVDRFQTAPGAAGRTGDIVTCPLARDGQTIGVIAVEVSAGGDAQRRACAKALIARPRQVLAS